MTNHVSYGQTVENLQASLMRKPLLNSLRMFDAAARHGNFRLAADELNLTQGAVAQQVRKLEADLGQPLFTRLPRGLELTNSGARYHRDIRKALDLIDRATEALRPDTTNVTLSVPPSLATKWLVPRLAQFAETHPFITLDLSASEALTDFRRDAVDLAIRQGATPREEGLNVHRLASLDLCAVASPSYQMSGQAIEDIQDFSDHKLIQDGHRHWTRMFQSRDLAPPTVALSFNQTALAIDAAMAGQGIAMAPRLLVSDTMMNGNLVEIWRAPHNADAYYIVHPNRDHPARDNVVA
ncbi:MAG: LysR substrate-binding domain-containing protein, partial [Marinomonas sp.]